MTTTNQRKMVQLTDSVWAIELTNLGDVFKSFRILPPDNVWTVPYLKYSYRSIYHTKLHGKDFYCSEENPLENGSWQFLFTTNEATWEQAESVVEKINGWYKDYVGDIGYSDPGYSLQSLLSVKGCNLSKNYAIIQRGE